MPSMSKQSLSSLTSPKLGLIGIKAFIRASNLEILEEYVNFADESNISTYSGNQFSKVK